MSKDAGDGLRRVIQAELAITDFHALYPSVVQGQGADYSVDLLPDDPKMRGNGYQGVPLRLGLPGARVRVKTGASVLLGFRNGSPAAPYAALWEYSGAYEIVFKPDTDGEVRIETDGSGTVTIKSESRIVVESPDVRLGAAPGSGVATEGDLVVIPGTSVAAMFTAIAAATAGTPPAAAAAAAFAAAMALPSALPLAGQIATGAGSVKA
jgi:hypothetical protein